METAEGPALRPDMEVAYKDFTKHMQGRGFLVEREAGFTRNEYVLLFGVPNKLPIDDSTKESLVEGSKSCLVSNLTSPLFGELESESVRFYCPRTYRVGDEDQTGEIWMAVKDWRIDRCESKSVKDHMRNDSYKTVNPMEEPVSE